MNNKEAIKDLLSQVRDSYIRAAYTHKTHEKQADIYFNKNKWNKGIKIFLASVISSSVIINLLKIFSTDPQIVLAITSLISFILAIYTALDDTFEYFKEMQKHKEFAAKIYNIREGCLSLIADIKSGTIDIEDIKNKRDNLHKDYVLLASKAPRTTPKAYSRARKALKNDEELTSTNHEIDNLLPERLRGFDIRNENE